MRKGSLKFWLFCINCCLLICAISCKKSTSSLPDITPRTFSDVFEQYWNKMNANYVYWDIDTTNWNNIYTKYKSLFSKLDINNITHIRKSVSYFREMSRGLIDAHYYISFTQNSIIDSFVYPAYERKKDEIGFHNPYPFYKIDTNYLDAGFQLCIDNNYSFDGQPLVVLYGTINNNVLYFSCNHFSLSKVYYSITANKIQPIINLFFSALSNLPSNIKGLIIDVRSNYGGDLSDLNFLVGRFIDKPLLFGYTQYKIGNGKFDFSSWLQSYITPQSNSKPLSIPIIVLADNVSASLSEAVVMAIKAMPNSTFIGEKTFGATGPIVNDSYVYNDGNFSVPGFLKVQASSAKFKYIDGKSYESIGFSPNFFVQFNILELERGNDIALCKAISLIN